MIISIGYRVKSEQGILFRIWANRVLKEYLLKGHVTDHRILQAESKINILEKRTEALETIVKTALPPTEGIFYDGQIFDAYAFVNDIIKTAKASIILIDNYIDETVLTMLSKHRKEVKVSIYTQQITKQLKLDIEKYNTQYPAVDIFEFKKSHDRFLIIDHKTIYHIGASLKDLGKRWFAFSKINLDANEILHNLKKP